MTRHSAGGREGGRLRQQIVSGWPKQIGTPQHEAHRRAEALMPTRFAAKIRVELDPRAPSPTEQRADSPYTHHAAGKLGGPAHTRALKRALEPALQGLQEGLLPTHAEVRIGLTQLRMVLDTDVSRLIEQRNGVEHGGAEAGAFHIH
jgi:hypothetical protein